MINKETAVQLEMVEKLTNSIDKLIFRRLASLIASSDNAKERAMLGAQAREELKAALAAIIGGE